MASAMLLRGASLIAQLVKNRHAMQETLFQFLGREDPLEKGWATQSSINGLSLWLSWWRIHLQCGTPVLDPWVGKIPWRMERLSTPVFWPGEFHGLYSPWGCRVRHDWATFTFFTWRRKEWFRMIPGLRAWGGGVADGLPPKMQEFPFPAWGPTWRGQCSCWGRLQSSFAVWLLISHFLSLVLSLLI